MRKQKYALRLWHVVLAARRTIIQSKQSIIPTPGHTCTCTEAYRNVENSLTHKYPKLNPNVAQLMNR